MRAVTFALVGLLFIAACGQQEAVPGGGQAASGASEMEHEALVGVWSFDRSCASGDGMALNADGTASFDEWGAGQWRVADGNRVILTLDVEEPGAGPTGERETIALRVTPPVTDDLNVEIGGDPPRNVTARRCE